MDYYAKGYTPVWKFSEIRGTGAKEVWTPTTSTRIALTGLSVSSGPGGTIQLRFGNTGGNIIGEFFVSASASFSPVLSNFESTTYDRSLFAEVSASTSDGWRITATGFEID